MNVRLSALLGTIQNYSSIMGLWNECLVNKNLTIEMKLRVVASQNQKGNFTFIIWVPSWTSFVFSIFRNQCRAKKCRLPLLNVSQTFLSHYFNYLELKNLSNLFTMSL